MAGSAAKTVRSYLAALPAERRRVLEAVRKVVLDNLDAGYEEGIQYGMIGWYVPHRIYPAGYHADPRQPLPFGALAARKNHCSLYLMGLHGGRGTGEKDETVHARWFRAEWAKTGKTLDMGQACVRFRTLDDLPLDLVGRAIARIPARAYIAAYEKAVGVRPAAKAGRPRTRPSASRRSGPS